MVETEDMAESSVLYIQAHLDRLVSHEANDIVERMRKQDPTIDADFVRTVATGRIWMGLGK